MKIQAVIALGVLALFFSCSKKMTRVESTPPEKPASIAAPARSDEGELMYRKTKRDRKNEDRIRASEKRADTRDMEIERLRKELSEREVEYEKSVSSDMLMELEEAPRAGYHSGAAAAPERRASMASQVKAAAHNDNEEFYAYRQFCKSVNLPNVQSSWKPDERYIIRVVDQNNNPVHKVEVTVSKGNFTWTANTPASGEIVLFPKMDLDPGYNNIEDYEITVEQNSQKVQPSSESVITVQLDRERILPKKIPLQICFLLDATGSMEDEIQQLKDVIFSIHSRIVSHQSNPAASFSLVAYRDKGDAFLVKGYPFTSNIDSFQIQLEPLHAQGGGDTPEDVCAGLQYSMESLNWNPDAVKFVFLVGDAPPQVGRYADKNYLWAARKAREKGIRIVTVGASGLNTLGEFVFRQIALLTEGEFVFLHYGESGESSGAGTVSDPGKVSHHTGSNYNARRLDDIVVDIVTKDLGYLMVPSAIVRQKADPGLESDLYDVRLTNLLQQVFRSDLELKQKTVVLSPFAVEDSTLSDVSNYLWETAIEKAINIAPVNIVERNKMEELLKENSLSLTGLSEENPDPKVGKLLNADYMVFSRLHYVGTVRMCHMRMVECTSGKVISASRVKF